MEISRARFEELVASALDSIPDELARRMSNVAITVEDENDEADDHLLGLYTGIPLTERYNDYSGVFPDVIEIYKGPICRYCATEDEIIEEVRITVLHEVAHHFGIDDDELKRLGWA